MSAINVMIVEDTVEESDLLIEVLNEHGYNIVGIARTFKDALTLFHANTVDLFIIDIFLDGSPDGILFAETVTTIPGCLRPFVFLTSSKDRQIFERAKLTKPFSFLMKPFNELEVLYAIEMAIEKFHEQPQALSEESQALTTADFLFIKKKNNLKKVLYAEILYVEVEERYCNVVTEEEKYIVQLSLTKMENNLPASSFKRTHRNFIVNTNYITSVDTVDNLIHLKGGAIVLFSETYKDFLNHFQVLR